MRFLFHFLPFDRQLRPKVNNYQLTVEKGDGFDLNRSLFERLVLKGYPHVTLSKQHRMRPEISTFVRHLTYPDLVDGEKTQGRPNIAGVRDNVVFIHHSSPEDDHSEFDQSGIKSEELGSKSSKRNQHEVVMVLKILRYLVQQGYGTDDIVILTGYLGQLRALQEALRQANNDTILSDLDSADLVRAGLINPTAAEETKRPIRLATIGRNYTFIGDSDHSLTLYIDNYQGEESDIVIASLTRSNKQRNIGFMARADRLNVLLSRARNGLIMVGDAHTFKGAKSQDNVWGRFFDLLIQNGHLYDGLPVRCERHPEYTADLCQPEDFDRNCADGGCNRPW
jgi:superfamily I DNA and/or RNA helicase